MDTHFRYVHSKKCPIFRIIFISRLHHFFTALFFILFFSINVFSQPVCQIEDYSLYKGLPQRTVVNIIQDNKGFIWFSTWNGLTKFDGYTFKNYKSYPGDGCTLTSNRLFSITPNHYGDIWCQTYDSRVYLFDSKGEKFIDVLQPFEQEHKENYIVSHIYALPKGITWIVCQHEAFRVDEQAFNQGNKTTGIIRYSVRDGKLPGEKVSLVIQDKEEDEWVFTEKGIRIIGRKKMPGEIQFKHACEHNGNMYLISDNNRLAVYNLKNEQLQFLKNNYLSYPLYNIKHIGEETLALGTDNGIILLDTRSKTFSYADLRTEAQPTLRVLNIFRDSRQELWAFSENAGVTRYNPISSEKQHYRTPLENMPKAERKSRDLIFEDNQGYLWMVPHLGCLSYYDPISKELCPYYTDYKNPASKLRPVILQYLLDNQKNLWISNSYHMSKISFYPNACRTESLDHGFDTRAFLNDSRGLYWAATKKGLVRIYQEDGSLKGYLTSNGQISKQPATFSANVYCFLEDRHGRIWMGTKRNGIYLLTPNPQGDSFRIRHFTHNPQAPYSLSNNSIYSIYQDSRQRIWIGTYGGGINLFEETPEGDTRFLHNGNELRGYPHSKYAKVRTITEVNGALLTGTTEGLLASPLQFEHTKEISFSQHVRIPNDASSLCSNDVIHIFTDSKKRTYILTFTGGISRILSEDLLSGKIHFKSYTKREGLISDLVLSMIEDNQKRLWVISENSLFQFDPEKETFEEFSSRYRQENVYFTEAVPIVKNGHLILGTEAGILHVNPELFRKSDYVPPVMLTDIRVQGVPRETDVNDLKELKLQPSERNVTFQFAALDYSDPSGISYAYRLSGLEESWNEVGNNRTANYINLAPGTYELEIRSTNSDGIWMDNTRVLPVIVLPTFWETRWAWLLYILLFIFFTGVTVYIIIYIYQLQHRINLEQQLADIKLRFFTDISHELRTPLTLITSPVNEVLQQESLSPRARKHLTLVHNNTERMLRLVNQILDFRKIENRKMKLLLEQTDVTEMLHRITDEFRLLAEKKEINFRLITEPEAIHCWIDRDKFEKILFNLISNAFKYTPAHKSITVSATLKQDKLTVSIKDEGIGIDPKKQQTLFVRFETLVRHNILQSSSGIGLSLVKELIEMHMGSIHVNSNVGEGSEFTIVLPAKQEAYEKCEYIEFILNDGTNAATTEEQEREILDTQVHQVEPMQKETERTSAEPSMEQERDSETLSVLIVEDNNELREFLRNILSDSYRVIEASNGQEGLELSLQHIPDFIISDVMMPVMDGLDMVKSLKEHRDVCHIPIVLLSAKSSLDDRINGLEQGIDDYITKPFSSSYLKARIKSLLEQRKQLQKRYLEQWSEQKTQPSLSESLSPAQPHIVSFDKLFMEQVMQVMEQQMDNADFTIDDFARQLNMGRTVFYQKLKGTIGLSPVDFIREMRVKRAKQLIDSGEYNISTIAYMTGFNDPKYFSKCFKKQFGLSPSEYNKERK